MILNRNDPVYFKILPITEDRKTNAVFLRELGDCNGEPCCEILYRQERWIVRNSEVLSIGVAMQKAAEKCRDEINATGKTKFVEIAKALGICTGTLRKRRKLIANHFGKDNA